MKQLALELGLAPAPSLAAFFPGPNAEALQHVRLALGTGHGLSPVPTYLWGEAGTGKSHLLRAVREALREHGAVCGWCDADTTNPPSFDERWTAVLLDDVHLFSSEQQASAFNWFVNALNPATGSARWVLAAGSLPPADLPLRDDLRTRLGWGHVFQLHTLSEAERRAVLRQHADVCGLFLGDDVLDFMLKRFSRDLGSLMQLFDRLDRHALRTQRALTVPLLKDLLESSGE